MTPFSPVVDTQLDALRSYGAKAVDRVEKVFALNLGTGRAVLEKSSATMQQWLAVKDPRDFLVLASQSQQHFDSLLAYGRELFSIATEGALGPMAPAVKPVALNVTQATAEFSEAMPVALAEPKTVVAKAKPVSAAKPAVLQAAKPAPLAQALETPALAASADMPAADKPVDKPVEKPVEKPAD
ncbi:MAG: phasin family protein [Pseudomonadota bacterium]